MKKRFEALDGLRGVCALFVVIFHLHFAGSLSELAFFRNSAIFVEFFFVLSGFVLVHGYASKSNLKFSTFVSTRFFRLDPLHIFMFIIFVFLELIRLSLHKIAGISFNKEAFTGSTAISEIIPNILLNLLSKSMIL